jgi:hypothetical protein
MVPMAAPERDRMCWRGCVRSAAGPLSLRQSKAGCAKESDREQEDPVYSVKHLHQPPVTLLLISHYSRAVRASATLGGARPHRLVALSQ